MSADTLTPSRSATPMSARNILTIAVVSLATTVAFEAYKARKA